jgi:hypothetical protein
MTGSRMEVRGKNIMKHSFMEVEEKEENCGIEKSFDYLNGLENKYIQTTCGNQHSPVSRSLQFRGIHGFHHRTRVPSMLWVRVLVLPDHKFSRCREDSPI